MSDWFYGKDGTQHGPISDQEVRHFIASGQIDGSTIIWREGMADWLPANQVSEFQSAIPTTGAGTSPVTATPTTPYAPTPQAYTTLPTDGLSIAALVCGIMAIICCYVWGLFGLPAVICGHMSISKINNSETPIGGKGIAITGIILGYIGIALQLLMIVGFVFFFTSRAQASKF